MKSLLVRGLPVTLLAAVLACGDDQAAADQTGTDGTAASTGTGDSTGTGTGSTTSASGFSTTGATSTSSTSSTTEDDSAGDETATPWVCEDLPRAETTSLIDDFENGPPPQVDGRRGGWYTWNDMSGGTQVPEINGPVYPTDEDAHGGQYSVHTTGSGFSDWGAEIGISLNYYDGRDCPYDVSNYEGLSFWAKGEGEVRLRVASRATVPVESGGLCRNGCWDDFGMDLELTDTWQLFEVRWDEMTQSGWGMPAEFDPTDVLWIHWIDESGESVDIWLDDLHFLPVDEPSGTGTGSESGSGDDGSESGSSSETAGTSGTEASSESDSGSETGSEASGSTGDSSGGSDDASSTGVAPA